MDAVAVAGGPVSIHAPREGRDVAVAVVRMFRMVSIHAPREGRDARRFALAALAPRFQSTRPVKGATP